MEIKIDVSCANEFGFCSYIGIDMDLQRKLFENHFPCCTTEITCFIGAVHGLMYGRKLMQSVIVYVNNVDVAKRFEQKNYSFMDLGNNNEKQKAVDFLRRSTLWVIEQRSGIDVRFIQK